MALVLRMCFKKPKLPEKTAEDIQYEVDLKELRAIQQREIALGLSEQKNYQTEASFARAMGMVGNRSLISGSKGGSGYMNNKTGRGTGKPTLGSQIAPDLSSRQPSAPPIMNYVDPGTIANFSGFPFGPIADLSGYVPPSVPIDKIATIRNINENNIGSILNSGILIPKDNSNTSPSINKTVLNPDSLRAVNPSEFTGASLISIPIRNGAENFRFNNNVREQ